MQERLNKLIAQAGIASRRHAEDLIKAGEVAVNGEVITVVGAKADPETDHIKVGGKLINAKLQQRAKVYVLLNKPKGYLSSAADPEGRKLVTDLVPPSFGRLYPVGRLDYNTEGLIILTNDGEFTNTVASSRKVPKVYEVKVKGLPNENAVNKLRRGIRLEDGFMTAPAEIKPLKSTENNAWYEVTLFEGHNQQIRKMFDAVGNSVVKLRRIQIGHVKDENMPIGAFRELEAEEVKEFISPSNKPAKKSNAPAAASGGEKPELRAHSRTVKPKRPKTAKAKNNPKARKSLKDAFKAKMASVKESIEKSPSSGRSEPAKAKPKRSPAAVAPTGLSKFKNASSRRKPKR